MIRRREFLGNALLVGGLALAPLGRAPAAERIRFVNYPFKLGVASGYPSTRSVVLWTRLAPDPLAPDGGMQPSAVPVTWELAADEGFRQVLRRGVTYAEPYWAHSVHVEPPDLSPGREYWYRFTAGDVRSAVGRTWTAPEPDSSPERLRIGLACCQQYEHGYYVAYRKMLADQLDLIVHVGDYIYELSWGEDHVRSHDSGECYTLEDYRARHALYRSDPDLKAAHAACPWLLTWDDHEVDNDYAGAISEQDDDPRLFLARRAAAYRAYYEHLPLPRQAAPFGADDRLYTARTFGDLATLYLLDERQYRSPQACPAPGQRGSNRVFADGCPELTDPARTMLGERQERWLDARLAERGRRARWNLLAQGVVFAYANEAQRPRRRFWTDSWNGYPAARERLLRTLAERKVRNPLVLGGDVHAFVASDLRLEADDPTSPRVASEIVTTSITSQPPPSSLLATYRLLNPDILLADGDYRGYVRLELTPQALRADLVAVETVKKKESAHRVLKSFVLEDEHSGLAPA
jgi:alkaline phosphatase D